VVNWAEKRPSFTYGPKDARTMVAIVAKGPLLGLDGKYELPTIQSRRAEAHINLGPIKCIGPGLYDYEDDGTFAQWMRDYPYSEDEAFVIKEELTSPPHEEPMKVDNNDTEEENEEMIIQQFCELILREGGPAPMEDTPMLPQPGSKEELPKEVGQSSETLLPPIVVPKPKLESIQENKVISPTTIPLYLQQFDYAVQHMPCTFCTRPGKIQKCQHRGQPSCLSKLTSPSPAPDLQELREHLRLTEIPTRSESPRIVEEQEKIDFLDTTHKMINQTIPMEYFPKESTAKPNWIAETHYLADYGGNPRLNRQRFEGSGPFNLKNLDTVYSTSKFDSIWSP